MYLIPIPRCIRQIVSIPRSVNTSHSLLISPSGQQFDNVVWLLVLFLNGKCMGADRPIPAASSGDPTPSAGARLRFPRPQNRVGAALQVPLGRRVGGSRGLTQVSLFLLGASGFFLFSFKPVLVGGEGEISFQFPPPLLQSRAALGEREALKHSGQADFSGSSLPPPTPAPPPHDWGGGDGGRRWCPPHRQRLTLAGRGGGDGKNKRAPRAAKKGSPPSRLAEPRLLADAFLSAGLPFARRQRRARSSPGTRGSGARAVSAAGSARLAQAAAAGQRSSGRSPPAALNYSWGVYYIRSHKLEPLCNAIRERYARPLLLLLLSGSLSL